MTCKFINLITGETKTINASSNEIAWNVLCKMIPKQDIFKYVNKEHASNNGWRINSAIFPLFLKSEEKKATLKKIGLFHHNQRLGLSFLNHIKEKCLAKPLIETASQKEERFENAKAQIFYDTICLN